MKICSSEMLIHAVGGKILNLDHVTYFHGYLIPFILSRVGEGVIQGLWTGARSPIFSDGGGLG